MPAGRSAPTRAQRDDAAARRPRGRRRRSPRPAGPGRRGGRAAPGRTRSACRRRPRRGRRRSGRRRRGVAGDGSRRPSASSAASFSAERPSARTVLARGEQQPVTSRPVFPVAPITVIISYLQGGGACSPSSLKLVDGIVHDAAVRNSCSIVQDLDVRHAAYPGRADGSIPGCRRRPAGRGAALPRLRGAFYCRAELTRAVGARRCPPCAGCLWFHVITAGSCLARGARAPSRGRLRPGTSRWCPHGEGHVLRSDPGRRRPTVLRPRRARARRALRDPAPRRRRGADRHGLRGGALRPPGGAPARRRGCPAWWWSTAAARPSWSGCRARCGSWRSRPTRCARAGRR